MGRQMIFVTVASLVLLTSASFAQSAQDNKPNQLTAEEKAAGWKLLFDGKS